EDGIRDRNVTGVQTCALPISFAPGANPSYGAEQNGLLASLNSVAKLPYHWALDGISNTQTINPDALGHSEGERVENLVQVMDGRSEEHTSELQSRFDLVCRLLLEKKKGNRAVA